MAEIKIIKASAGSGKTFKLTREYLSLLFAEFTDYFRTILAVTFTNKATAEMKERILAELHTLASGAKSDHLEYLAKSTEKKEDFIRNKAQTLLQKILHGYFWFRVETIDTFFQRVIRGFTRELNIPGQYNVELDQEKVLNDSVDRFFEGLNEDSELLDWLTQMVEKKINEGKGWGIKDELIKLGKQLFNEKFQANSENLTSILSDRKKVQGYKLSLQNLSEKFESQLKTFGEKAFKIIEANKISSSDLYYGATGPYGFFSKLRNAEINIDQPINSRVLDVYHGNKDWASGKAKDPKEINAIGDRQLRPVLEQCVELLNSDLPIYLTAQIISKNINSLAVLFDIAKEMDQYCQEKGLFLISDSSPFIYKIIDNNDAPFIYEKIGNRFNHYMIDEFQDTSGLQWENFKPLISNSLANGHSALLVGDVKQSIYRWRNSEWEILAKGVKEQFDPSVINENTLDTNWRSSPQVINFNNFVFTEAVEFIKNTIWSMSAESSKNIGLPSLDEIYEDVKQNVSPTKQGSWGYVQSKFYSSDDKKADAEYYRSDLVNGINQLLESGYQPGDISVLVRTKAEGKTIAELLIDANQKEEFVQQLAVLSNESLVLTGSSVVRAIVNVLYYLDNPSDYLHFAGFVVEMKSVFSEKQQTELDFPPGIFTPELGDAELSGKLGEFIKSCKGLPLFEIVLQIINRYKLSLVEQEMAYLHSFLDLIHGFSIRDNPSLSSFLEYWEESGSEKSISVSEERGAIRILTIHKSKGLEFPAVIIPFCSWDIKPKSGSMLWVTPQDEPFSDLSPVPVEYGLAMEGSTLAIDYHIERYRTLVDNINLLYVAFTRAKKALFTFSIAGNKTPNMGDINYHITQQLLNSESLSDLAWDEDKSLFKYGSIEPVVSADPEEQKLFFTPLAGLREIPLVKLSMQARDLLKEINAIENTPASRGSTWHAILQNVIHKKDLQPAVAVAIEQGVIDPVEGREIEGQIKEMFKNEIISDWFNENYRVLNERDILLPGGGVKRPDRVVLGKDRVIVVDYKFGDDESMEHKQQVADYKDIMLKVGYENVDGYLWYVHNEKIVEV